MFGLLLGAMPAAAQVRVFSGATLIDGSGGDPIENAVLTVRNGRIQCVGASDACALPEGVEPINLSARWVTPGLVDAHVHLAQTAWADGRPDGMDVTDQYPYPEVVARQRNQAGITFRSYLCSGITAVFDVGGFPWSWALRSGRPPIRGDGFELPPPHLAAAGPLLTWVPPRMELPAEQVMVRISGPDHGRRVVRYLVAFNSDAVKVWFLEVSEDPRPGNPTRAEVDAWVEAVGREASTHELPLIVHATGLREAKVAVRAGAHLLVHSISDQPVDEEFLQLAAQRRAFYTPTLIVSENWWGLAESGLAGIAPTLDDPHGCVDPATRTKIASTPQYRNHPYVARLDEAAVERRRRRLQQRELIMAENLRRVHGAGIPIVMGTDAGNPLTVHGPSVYAEMERMQAAGLKPADILVAATRNGAQAMRREAEIGTLEAGKWADFLVLTENPLEDVKAFRSITHVARAGRLTPVSQLSFVH